VKADQLAALFAKHRVPLLGVAGAGAVGLGLLHRSRGGSVPAAAGAPRPGIASASTAGYTYSSGSQAGGTTGGGIYDSSSHDLYSALQPQLENIIRNTTPGATGAKPPVPVPAQARIASTILAPTGSGNYVRGANGMVAEVQSDGSLFALTSGQWSSLTKTLGNRAQVTNLRGRLGGSTLPVYDTERNLRRQNTPPPTPVPAPSA
jgi:hypothetical protein